MTAKPKPPRTCPECRFDGGWHYDEAGNATRCPQYLATEAQAAALKLTADAHTEHSLAIGWLVRIEGVA